MKIKSDLMKGIVSRIVSKALRKELGRDIEIFLNDLYVRDGKFVNIHLDVNLVLEREDLKEIVKEKIGI